MDILIKALQLILSLSILVVLHEAGHFAPAKWFKTKVEKFYLFFNPGFSLFKKKIGETEYGIGWLPLGGYVKIAGMIDESFDKDYLEKEPEPWEFRSKPAWQRLIIMVGGVTVNVILGYLIFMMIAFTWGSTYIPTENVKDGIFVDSLGMEMGLRTGDKIIKIGEEDFVKFNPSTLIREVVINDVDQVTVNRNGQIVNIPIDEKFVKVLTGEGKNEMIFSARTPYVAGAIMKDSPAEKAGFQVEDKIIALNGVEYQFFDEYKEKIQEIKGQEAVFTIERENSKQDLKVNLSSDGSPLGIYTMPLNYYFESTTEKYTLGESIPVGIEKGNGFITDQFKAFKKMFNGKIKASDSLGSFISIGNMFPSKWDWEVFWKMTAMLSLILGILNLLPIPGLDGGHVVFLIWEVFTGRKVSDKVVEYATMVGFIILICLMVFALGLDIKRFF